MNHLLLLHGALGHPQQFAPYERELEAHFQLHKLLFQGHGGSGIPEEGLSIEGFVRQVADYIHVQHLKKVNIFGYSMGGYVGLLYAARFPEQVASVLTLATKFHWTEAGALQEAQLLNPDAIQEKVPSFAKQLAGWHGETHWKRLLPAIKGLLLGLGSDPLLSEAVLSGIQLPVQLMAGEKDRMVSVEETQAAAAMLPHGKVVALPETRHPFEQVNAPAFMNALKSFWNIASGL